MLNNKKIFATIFSIFILIIAAGSYLYFSQEKQQKVAQKNNSNQKKQAKVNCKKEDYSCSLAKSDKKKLAENISFASNLRKKIVNQNLSASEIKQKIKNNTESSKVISDGNNAVIYPKDSIPVAIYNGSAPNSSRTALENKDNFSTSLKSLTGVEAVKAQEKNQIKASVAGSDSSNRRKKEVLILSPLSNSLLLNTNITDVVANKIDKSSQYNVDVQKAKQVSPSSFKNWEKYDLVHIDSWGGLVCDKTKDENSKLKNCQKFMFLKRLSRSKQISKDKLINILEKSGSIGDPGLGSIFVVGPKYTYFATTPDTFKFYYTGVDLKNTIISLNIGAGDWSEVFSNSSGNIDLFQWDNLIKHSISKQVFKKLYKNLIEYGQPAKLAYKNIPDSLKLGNETRPPILYLRNKNEIANNLIEDKDGATADFTYSKLGKKTNHAREVITILNLSGQKELEPNTTYSFDGAYGDGKQESTNLIFRLEGYSRSELENGNFRLNFRIDDKKVISSAKIKPSSNEKPKVRKTGTREWRITFENIKVPDQKPNSRLKFAAKLILPGGGDSKHKVSPVKTGFNDVKAEFKTNASPFSANITFDSDSKVYKVNYKSKKGDKIFYYDEKTGIRYMNSKGGMVGIKTDVDTSVNKIPYSALEDVSGVQAMSGEFIPNLAKLAKVSQVGEPTIISQGFKKKSYPCGQGSCKKYVKPNKGTTVKYNSDGLMSQWSVGSQGNTIKTDFSYGSFKVSAPSNARVISASPSKIEGISRMAKQLSEGFNIQEKIDNYKQGNYGQGNPQLEAVEKMLKNQ